MRSPRSGPRSVRRCAIMAPSDACSALGCRGVRRPIPGDEVPNGRRGGELAHDGEDDDPRPRLPRDSDSPLAPTAVDRPAPPGDDGSSARTPGAPEARAPREVLRDLQARERPVHAPLPRRSAVWAGRYWARRVRRGPTRFRQRLAGRKIRDHRDGPEHRPGSSKREEIGGSPHREQRCDEVRMKRRSTAAHRIGHHVHAMFRGGRDPGRRIFRLEHAQLHEVPRGELALPPAAAGQEESIRT